MLVWEVCECATEERSTFCNPMEPRSWSTQVRMSQNLIGSELGILRRSNISLSFCLPSHRGCTNVACITEPWEMAIQFANASGFPNAPLHFDKHCSIYLTPAVAYATGKQSCRWIRIIKLYGPPLCIAALGDFFLDFPLLLCKLQCPITCIIMSHSPRRKGCG